MRHHDKRTTAIGRIAGVVVLAALVTAGCGMVSRAADTSEPPVTVKELAGSDLKELTLSERAAERLGVETQPVADASSDGQVRLVVPYAAVLYDGSGDAWVYVATGPRTFVRSPITIAHIEADRVVLSDGPTAGAEVVTVGVAELHGVESGVGGGH